jgi:hypothetical protein
LDHFCFKILGKTRSKEGSLNSFALDIPDRAVAPTSCVTRARDPLGPDAKDSYRPLVHASWDHHCRAAFPALSLCATRPTPTGRPRGPSPLAQQCLRRTPRPCRPHAKTWLALARMTPSPRRACLFNRAFLPSRAGAELPLPWPAARHWSHLGELPFWLTPATA